MSFLMALLCQVFLGLEDPNISKLSLRPDCIIKSPGCLLCMGNIFRFFEKLFRSAAFYLPFLLVFSQTKPSGRVDCLVLPPTCLPHKNGSISLGALPKDTTSKLAHEHNKQVIAGLFSTLSFMLSAKQESCEYHFLKSFSIIQLGK